MLPSKTQFDGVLVDAPCSNTGTWRRNPDARWTLTPDAVTDIAAIQAEVIRTCAKGVKPGGKLIYATCSLAREENEAIIESFLKDFPEFTLTPVPHPATGAETNGMMRTWPFDGDCDGMFVALMTKKA